MSDVPKTMEDTTAPAAEHTNAVSATEAATTAPEIADTQPATAAKPTETEAPVAGGEALPKEETSKTNKVEAAVEATPASEGVLGYKAPGLIPKLRFTEQFFWFDEAAAKPETLAGYLRSKELKFAHPNAAWAQETGKGLLFYAKRAEDKPSPEGIINLSDISEVTKIEDREFSFKIHSQKHTFQVATKEERASWIVAIEKAAGEAKGIKESVLGSEGYKNHLKAFSTFPALGATTMPRTNKSASREPKKSLDAATATEAPKAEAAATGAEESKKQKEPKSRSQSRKRSSIFGSLLGKKEERDEQKEVKKEEKDAAKEQKAEDKAEKKVEKEEAKATHDSNKAAEAGAAATGAAASAAVIATEEKKNDKHEEQKVDSIEKKGKRASIFGNIFAKKDATSPTAEKTEKDVAPVVPVKDAEVPPVSETAPKIEKPIENKPIDTAAVTAPIDTVQTPAAEEEPAKEPASGEQTTTPAKEKKGGIRGFIKKQEAKFEGKKEQKKEEKVEKKEEKAGESVSKEPVAAAAVDTPAATSEATAPATEEARPSEKRRQSLFSGLGTLKKKTVEPAPETETTTAETKKEKSPLPQKIGGLFRKPSKNPKPVEETKAETSSAPVTNGTTAQPEHVTTDEPAATVGNTTEESAVVGDVVPDNLHTSVHDAVTTSTPEVKAAA